MSDQVCIVLARSLLGLAIAIGLAAMVLDSVRQLWRKRLRCPKCWYDMSGSPGLTCSECGHKAKHERRLRKGRRYWRFIWLVALLCRGATC